MLPDRARYIRCLQTARPALDEQLADIDIVLETLREGKPSGPVGPSPLDRARAAYVRHLRLRRATFDQQVVELAALCAVLFLPELWAF